MKLLTADIRKRLLRNGTLRQQREQENKPEPDFWPVVKLFTPDGGCTWLLTEIDPEDPEQRPRFGLIERRCLARRHDVPGPAHRTGRVDRYDLAGH
jgi:hypothetical protein